MSDLRFTRESLGISRAELAELAGVTIGAVASLEVGRGTRDATAEQKIRTALTTLVRPKEQRSENERAPRAFKSTAVPAVRAGWEYLYEWNGMQPESRFTVIGQEGVFSFVRFVRNEKGSEWVDGIGGERGYPPAFRSFKPHLVTPFT